jgi:hypothetical protein
MDEEPRITKAPPPHIMQYFEYSHLPAHLQAASKPYCDLAKEAVQIYSDTPERDNLLRKLLEAKDSAVRCRLQR